MHACSCKYSSLLSGVWSVTNIKYIDWMSIDMTFNSFLFFTADNECNKDITKILGQRFIREINQTAWFSQLLYPDVYCVEFFNGTSLYQPSWRWFLGNSSISGEIFPLYMERIRISQMRLSLYALSILKYLPLKLMFYI